MSAHTARRRLRAHLVGSIPLPDADSVFRRLAAALDGDMARLPDGETGIRQSWIRFLQDALARHPALAVAADVPAFQFRQWDGTVVREIPRLRVIDADGLDPAAFASGYAEMALASWRTFARLQQAGVIAPGQRLQVSVPSPIAPTYNNMLPADRPAVLAALKAHFVDEVRKICAVIPAESLAIQWDVCQEVLALEGYYEPGPVDFLEEAVATLTAIGAAVPAGVELGYHLCYGSPLDEHLVQPRDAAVMVRLVNAVAASLRRPIDFVHFPVPKSRDDDGYFLPFEELALDGSTERYLGLVHYRDAGGDARRFRTALRHMRVDGVATECGMGRGDPGRLDELLAAHAALIRAAAGP